MKKSKIIKIAKRKLQENPTVINNKLLKRVAAISKEPCIVENISIIDPRNGKTLVNLPFYEKIDYKKCVVFRITGRTKRTGHRMTKFAVDASTHTATNSGGKGGSKIF